MVPLEPELGDSASPHPTPTQLQGACAHLDVHVQAVVEVPEPEEVSEAQRDVESAELPVAQGEQPQDVQVVLVPPVPGRGTQVRSWVKVQRGKKEAPGTMGSLKETLGSERSLDWG